MSSNNGLQIFRTIRDVVEALVELQSLKGEESLIRGNLKSAIWQISTELNRNEIYELAEKGNIEDLLKVLSEYKEESEITKVEQKQSDDENLNNRTGEVNAALVDELVKAYELSLENNDGDPARAKDDFLKKYNKTPRVQEFLSRLEAVRADCKEKLQKINITGQELEVVSQTLASAVVIEESKAGEAGVASERVGEVLINKAVESFQKEIEEHEAIDKRAKMVGEEIKNEINRAIDKSSEDLAEKLKYATDLEERATLTAQKMILDHQLELAQAELLEDLVNANKTPNDNGTLKISPDILNQRDRVSSALDKITHQNLGQLDKETAIEELKRMGFDVAATGEEISKYVEKVNRLLDSNPKTALRVSQEEAQKTIAAELLRDNPQLSTQEAYEYAEMATRFEGQFLGTKREAIIISAQNELEKKQEGKEEKIKDKPSHAGLSSKLTELQMMAGVATLSPREYEEFSEKFKKLHDKAPNIPQGVGSLRLRSLDNVMSLFGKDERLRGVLNLLQRNGGIKKLGENWLLSQKDGLIGKAVAGLAKGGLAEGAQSFFTGAAFKKGLQKGLVAVSERLATTGAGKVLLSVGAKLGISAAGVASGPIGWAIIGAGFVLGGVKKLLSKVGGFMSSIGLNLKKDMEGILDSIGMNNVLGKTIAGVLGLAAAGMGLIFGGIAAISMAVIGPLMLVGVLGVFAYQMLMGGNYGTFRPSTNVGGALSQQTARQLQDPVMFTGPIPIGCPDRYPVPHGSISKGPDSGLTHGGNSSESIDIPLGVGTEIRATHTGGVSCIYDNTGYGPMIDLAGQCPLPQADGTTKTIVFKTRYAHLSAFGEFCGTEVNAGDIIGYSGGAVGSYPGQNTTGPHLHYEIVNRALGFIGKFLPGGGPTRGCQDNPVCEGF